MVEAPRELKVWIYRKGNGGAYVFPPSPQLVKSGGNVTFQNLTTCMATVVFPEEGIVTLEGRPVSSFDVEPLPKGTAKTVTAVGPKGYYEYKVTLDCGDCGKYDAWASSDPGVIIDP